MAEGPRLPRKDTTLRHFRETLEGAAYQIGVLLAIQRHRAGLTQWELAQSVGGMEQIDISRIENGHGTAVDDQAIDRLFDRVDLPCGTGYADFVKWWRENESRLT